MKKKILSICLVAVIAVMAIAGASLAYLTDTDDADNVFEVGNVQIELVEQQRNENGELEAFEDDKTLMPIVGSAQGEKDGYGLPTAKNYVDKIVTVTNTGRSPAYIRTIYAIPVVEGYDEQPVQTDNWLHWNVFSHTDTKDDQGNGTNGWFWGTKDTGDYPDDVNDWNSIKDGDKPAIFEIDGAKYMIYIATNVNEIAPEEETTVAFRGLFLDPKVGCEVVEVEGDSSNSTEKELNYYIPLNGKKVDLGDISNLKILVFAQAVQSEGFVDAWEAFAKSGLPENPWA